MHNKFGFDNIGFGMGLRTVHFPHILDNWPEIDWFEIISENFMDTDGRPVRVLEKVCEKYPVVMHGVSMSIGSTDPLNKEYLKKLKKLAEWVNPPWISDHLCWTGINKKDTHDLLPVPYTEEALKHIVDRIGQVQDFLGRPLILENPSTYLEFKDSEMTEWDFIANMAKMSGCGLLLDVNNIYVSCYNHGWDEKTYIDAIPSEHVVQMHIAGHLNKGTHIVDTHEGPIIDPIWDLYRYTVGTMGKVSTMVEWDTDIPEFEVVKAEVDKAKQLAENLELPNDIPSNYKKADNDNADFSKREYENILQPMHGAIISGDSASANPEDWIPEKENFSSEDQLSVYIKGYRYRLFDLMYDDFPATLNYLGHDKITKLIFDYIEDNHSGDFNLSHYVFNFPEFSKKHENTKDDLFAQELIVFETAIDTIFDLEETEALTQEKLGNLDPEAFFSYQLKPRKALELFEFKYPVNEYYKSFKNDENPKKPEQGTNYLAVYRHNDEMLKLALDKNEYKLLNVLFEGKEIGEAIEQVISEIEENDDTLIADFQNWFSRWMGSSILAA